MQSPPTLRTKLVSSAAGVAPHTHTGSAALCGAATSSVPPRGPPSPWRPAAPRPRPLAATGEEVARRTWLRRTTTARRTATLARMLCGQDDCPNPVDNLLNPALHQHQQDLHPRDHLQPLPRPPCTPRVDDDVDDQEDPVDQVDQVANLTEVVEAAEAGALRLRGIPARVPDQVHDGGADDLRARQDGPTTRRTPAASPSSSGTWTSGSGRCSST